MRVPYGPNDSLMGGKLKLEFNRLLLNREYILMNVLKAFASIISMCNLRTILLTNIKSRYFRLFTS
jgi:hypothetical protein